MSKRPVRYNFKLLLECMNRDNAILDLKIYTPTTYLTSHVKIEGICNCGKSFNKDFVLCHIKSGMFCNECAKKNRNQKCINTCKENNGTDHPLQNKEIYEKRKATCLKIYDSEHPLQNSLIKSKKNTTCLSLFGTVHPSKLQSIKDKMKITCQEKYGADSALQNPEILEKHTKSSYRRKEFCMPSGEIRIVQGYEPYALTILLQKYTEEDIITGAENVPDIWYNYENERKRHFVDIYIKSINTCIEVKSNWTYDKNKEKVIAKQQASKELGLRYEIWIMNDKGFLTEQIL